VEGEALLTRFPTIETGNLDYQIRDIVALVARVLVNSMPVDVYRHPPLHVSRLRFPAGFQVQQLFAWIDTLADGTLSIVCGDFNATLAHAHRISARRLTSRPAATCGPRIETSR
jgi:endonuclease/exonuclease/phosphatase family metal-dependent hydrolase